MKVKVVSEDRMMPLRGRPGVAIPQVWRAPRGLRCWKEDQRPQPAHRLRPIWPSYGARNRPCCTDQRVDAV